jgi:DNA-binding PadR family transcriptional regulator
MEIKNIKALQREILLGFWKAHILYHASKAPLVGQWMLRELRRHGYEVSPGTIYPLLARMEKHGWLKCRTDPRGGLRARKEYSLTGNGRELLSILRNQIEELYREVVLGKVPLEPRQ